MGIGTEYFHILNHIHMKKKNYVILVCLLHLFVSSSFQGNSPENRHDLALE